MKTKDRIVFSSIDLFNRSGVVPVTTNHIAKALDISPGNLYFHFSNKEEIIVQIFKSMQAETYALWKTQKGSRLKHPLEVIEANFELYWKYRFLWRESYYLRKKDPQLAEMWKDHVEKVLRLMTVRYKRWMNAGWMRPIQKTDEVDFLVNVLLATASTFLHYFENAEPQAPRTMVETCKRYLARLLNPYTQGTMKTDFETYISSAPVS